MEMEPSEEQKEYYKRNGTFKDPFEEQKESYKRNGIFLDRKCNPSTSSGRYFFPRAYYEAGDGSTGMGLPNCKANLIEGPAALAMQVLSKIRTDITKNPHTGWYDLGAIRIHPEDTTVAMYSSTVLSKDPNLFTPDPNDYEHGIVTNWGLVPFTKDHALFASALLSQNTVGDSLYKGENDVYHTNPTIQFIKVLEQRKLDLINSEPVQAALSSSLVLRIELCENEKDVWRRIRVPASIDLEKLNDQVITPAMGWSRCFKAHVFEDPRDGSVIGSYPSKGQYPRHVDAMLALLDYLYMMNERNIPLALLLRNVGDVVFYTYDLSEQWVHKITVEEVVLTTCTQAGNDDVVSLLDGAGACPPENGKGLENRGCIGYAEFLRGYKKNPRKPKMREAVRLMRMAHNNNAATPGRPTTSFNPLHFDVSLHRQILARCVAGPSLRIKGALGSTKVKKSVSGCSFCGDRLKAKMKCSRCLSFAYCSRDCQIRHWREGGHSKECKKKENLSTNVETIS